MKISRIDTGPRMSQLVRHGNTLYISGQLAHKSRGQSVTAQTEEILGVIEDYLNAHGSDKDHMLFASVWLSDIKDFDAFNAVWDAWVPAGKAPARACVEARLVAPDFNVEVALTAAIKE